MASARIVQPSDVSVSPSNSEPASNADVTPPRNNDGRQTLDSTVQSTLNLPMMTVETTGNTPWYSGPSQGEGPFDVDLAWTFDYIMTRSDDTLHDLASHQISHAYGNPEEGHTANSTGTIESRSDWPDGQSRSTSPPEGHHVPSYSDSRFVDTNEIEESIRGNHLLLARYCTISSQTAKAMFELVTAEQLVGFCGRQPGPEEFPETRALQYFLLLYFIHVNPRFPVIHLPTFSPDHCFPDVLLAMILAGSCHSDSNQYTFCHAYMERARMSVTLQRERNGNHVSAPIPSPRNLSERLLTHFDFMVH